MPWWGWLVLFAAAYAIRYARDRWKTRHWTPSEREAAAAREERGRKTVVGWAYPPVGILLIVLSIVFWTWFSLAWIAASVFLIWIGVRRFREMHAPRAR